LLKFF
jgi:hypothetical protein